MVVVFWYFCILFYLYFVPFVLCCNCILLHLYLGNLYSVLLYFVVFVFWNFEFCSICILSHLYFIAFVFCQICILAICILIFCILLCYYGVFLKAGGVGCQKIVITELFFGHFPLTWDFSLIWCEKELSVKFVKQLYLNQKSKVSFPLL